MSAETQQPLNAEELAVLQALVAAEDAGAPIFSAVRANRNSAARLEEAGVLPASFMGRRGKQKLFDMLLRLERDGILTEEYVRNAGRKKVGVWRVTVAGRTLVGGTWNPPPSSRFFDAGTGNIVTIPGTPLKTLDHVRRELAKVYCAMKAGVLAPEDGTKRAYVLSTLGKVIEASILERRVQALEQQLLPGIGRGLLPAPGDGKGDGEDDDEAPLNGRE